MTREELQKALRELAEYWNLVEKRIKQAEAIRPGVVSPSIKELRYAGRWFVNFVSYALSSEANLSDPEVNKKVTEFLFETRLNVMQASHDAIDMMVHTIAKTFKRI